jgi:hypothetical protein
MGTSSRCCPKAGDITPLLRMDVCVHRPHIPLVMEWAVMKLAEALVFVGVL